ncbi:MAG TPA: DEAD/DEAH box helicase family protein [Bacteroidales bacterium]|nr:DEAD/DEAH box helicase family protein [Bacteroidales bacterium]
MSKLYLQNIVESIQWNNLLYEWLDFDFAKFSENKTLYDYQQQSLKNASKALYKYYIDLLGNKEQFFELYKNNGLTEKVDLDLKNNSKIKKIFQEFDKNFNIQDDRIEGYHFINRMSFWMATGSGKTLIVVKLIELLQSLMSKKLIPQKDILFLTYREDLLEQFKNHIEEFNKSNNTFFINLYDLKSYDSVKRENKLIFGNAIDIFYYRSDLISDEQKDKIIDFRNYDSNGNWYILLDEAHKGDREDSKRQQFYSILSRNGFLFNFSATFTNPIDFVTCAYNFNLEKFIQQGYGKQIYVLQSDISNLNKKEEFTEIQKQIIILKILLLYTYINEQKKIIGDKFYHKPLLLTLVNSVNTEDSDLYLFFKEIEKIATGKGDINILNQAKDELKIEINGKSEFTNENVQIDFNIINKLTYQDILINVFNANTGGKIEVLKIPENKQELIFKLKTSEKPFGLIKIGDISEWIKNKLSDYEIIEKFDDESIFKKLNTEDSDITMLMGSRAFYEGWDSNRPNIILYINIGKGTDARKFVLQSIGRGVRIEPLSNKRKRLQFLYNNKEINKNDFDTIKNHIYTLETLWIIGTKAQNLREVIKTLKEEKQEELLGNLFEINPEVKDKQLLIPIYKDSEKIIIEQTNIVKFIIHPDDYQLVKDYFNYIEEKICLIKYNCDLRVLKKIKYSFNNKTNDYFSINNEETKINNPELLLIRVFKHFINKNKEFDTFKELEEEIIHFKRINITVDKLNSLKEKIEKVKKLKDIEKELDQKFDAGLISKEKYKNKIKEIGNDLVKEAEVTYSSNEKLKIKFLANHYYFPVALAEYEKVDFIKHIIKHKSEVDFIKELEKHLQKEDNFFKQFDWWYFSKIDETLDEIYIPYYQAKTNRIEKFKPDYIFWLKKENDYTILFVDPKGTEHTDGYRKIDGYSNIFEIKEQQKRKEPKHIQYDKCNIKIKLLLKTNDIAKVLKNYEYYWFNEFSDLIEKLDKF